MSRPHFYCNLALSNSILNKTVYGVRISMKIVIFRTSIDITIIIMELFEHILNK